MIWLRKAHNLKQTAVDNFWGLGDMLRGTATLYLACEDMGLEFRVDLTHHVLAPCLESERLCEDVSEVPFKILDSLAHARRYIAEQKDAIIRFSTNGNNNVWDRVRQSADCKEFIRNTVLRYNAQTLAYFQSRALPSEYVVYHVRCGDQDLVLHNANMTDVQHKKARFLAFAAQCQDQIVFMTDSAFLKDSLRLGSLPPHVRISDSRPAHLGLGSDDDAIKSSLFDFYTLSKAKHIYAQSMSGFSFSASVLYDIPLSMV